VTPLERLVGVLPSGPADFRDYSDMVSQAIFDAAKRDRDAFVRVLEEEPTLLESSTVVFALGAIDDERLVPLLSDALAGKDSSVRWSAAHALSNVLRRRRRSSPRSRIARPRCAPSSSKPSAISATSAPPYRCEKPCPAPRTQRTITS
jgi:hypothetical protein